MCVLKFLYSPYEQNVLYIVVKCGIQCNFVCYLEVFLPLLAFLGFPSNSFSRKLPRSPIGHLQVTVSTYRRLGVRRPAGGRPEPIPHERPGRALASKRLQRPAQGLHVNDAAVERLGPTKPRGRGG